LSAVLRTIAAGVGGTSGHQALAWAADEAAESRARLVLLRACPSCSPLAQLAGEPPVLRLERADPWLARAVAATGVGPHAQRRLQIMVGDPGTALADASAGADLLVIGAGDVAAQVVRRSHCPVVVVHPAPARGGAPFADHVVVAVDGGDTGHAALDFAFTYADGHRLPLAAVHVTTGFPAERDALDLLGAEVEPWELKYPRVRVERSILSGTTVDDLVRAAAGARLLVIGSGAATEGGVSFGVTERAQCPVAVVPLEPVQSPGRRP
jgi:nucleotide-binding universal stress UspA family protein